MQVKMLHYSVVVLPKLDNEQAIQRLREKYDPWFYQVRPYIPIIPPFTPATLDEIEQIGSFISIRRHKLHPIAITCHRCIEVGDQLVCPVENGKDELAALHVDLYGSDSIPLVDDIAYEPRLVIGRVQDPNSRQEALREANRLGRTLGLVDAVSLIGIEPDGELRLVASYPFGIGRIDYYDTSISD
jgi:hypothetical protein